MNRARRAAAGSQGKLQPRRQPACVGQGDAAVSGHPAPACLAAAVPANDFSAPSPACRGLWFDGEHFWSAESIDGALGWIYRFDHGGAVTGQWLEPAFQGWAAAVVRDPQAIFADGFESGNTSRWSVALP